MEMTKLLSIANKSTEWYQVCQTHYATVTQGKKVVETLPQLLQPCTIDLHVIAFEVVLSVTLVSQDDHKKITNTETNCYQSATGLQLTGVKLAIMFVMLQQLTVISENLLPPTYTEIYMKQKFIFSTYIQSPGKSSQIWNRNSLIFLKIVPAFLHDGILTANLCRNITSNTSNRHVRVGNLSLFVN